MLKVGERVNVCFDGILEAIEMSSKPGEVVCKVSCRSSGDVFCIALVSEQFISSVLTTKQEEK